MNRFHELDDVGLLSEEADGGELREETPARVAQVRRGYVIAFLMLLVFNSTALVSLVRELPVGPVEDAVVALSETWAEQMARNGFARPEQFVRDLVTDLKEASW